MHKRFTYLEGTLYLCFKWCSCILSIYQKNLEQPYGAFVGMVNLISLLQEKERLRKEKKAEKQLNKKKKLELRRLKQKKAKELMKPKEDMCLPDHKVCIL